MSENQITTACVMLAVVVIALAIVFNLQRRRCFLDGLWAVRRKDFWSYCWIGVKAGRKDFTWMDGCCCVGLAVASAATGWGLWKYGWAQSWWAPSILIYPNWVVVVLAVGDQIRLNHETGKAHDQNSGWVNSGNFLQNVAWIMVGWAEDPLYAVRSIGVIFDQITFGQIVVAKATHEGKSWGLAWMASLAILFLVLSLFAVLVVPVWLRTWVMDPAVAKTLKTTALALVLLTTIGWADQIRKNWLAGPVTAKRYSLKISVLIEVSATLMMVYENLPQQGKIGSVVTVAAVAGLIVNTILMLQCLYFKGLWQASKPVDVQASAE